MTNKTEEKDARSPPEDETSEAHDESKTEESEGKKSSSPPFLDLFDIKKKDADDDKIGEVVTRQVKYDLARAGIGDEVNVLILHDSRQIARSDADRIYGAISQADRKKGTLLILSSGGGDVASAYLIAKLCREYTTSRFEVAVARRAKSAATLICCGADKIHMGSLSELGPIDPQFGNLPALAAKHSVENLTQLVEKYPKSAEMLSEYLRKTLPIEALGYYERVAESAAQYAERLLKSRVAINTASDEAHRIASHLVYAYKDHGFVIDWKEATEIFGSTIIVCNTNEYQAANNIYSSMEFIEWYCSKKFERSCAFVGGLENGPWFVQQGN